MLDFTKLWDKIYLFGPGFGIMSRSDRIIFWIGAVFVVLGVAAKIGAWYMEPGRPRKILLSRLFHLFLTAGLSLLVWYGARDQLIPWISTHFTALLVLAIHFVWAVFIGRYAWRDHRRQDRAWIEDKIKQKYLAR